MVCQNLFSKEYNLQNNFQMEFGILNHCVFLNFLLNIKVINFRGFSRQMAQTKNKTVPNVYFLRNSPPMILPHPSSIRDKRVQAGKF